MSGQDEGFLTWGRFRIFAGAAALLVFLPGLRLRFGYAGPRRPRPARPTAASPQAVRSLEYSENLYRAQLESDAREYGVEAPRGELELPFDYDLSEPMRTITAGAAPLATRDLLL